MVRSSPSSPVISLRARSSSSAESSASTVVWTKSASACCGTRLWYSRFRGRRSGAVDRLEQLIELLLRGGVGCPVLAAGRIHIDLDGDALLVRDGKAVARVRERVLHVALLAGHARLIRGLHHVADGDAHPAPSPGVAAATAVTAHGGGAVDA